MKFHSVTIAACLLVLVCLPSGLSAPLLPQDSPQAKTGLGATEVNPAKSEIQDCPNPVPKPKPDLDLCKLADYMNVPVKPDRRLGSTSLERQKDFSWKYHEDVTLRLGVDEVVFTCSTPEYSFQILSIERVRNPHDSLDCGVQPPPLRPSPFCPAFHANRVGFRPEKIQPPGTRLHTGAPVKGVGQWYKYSFKIGKRSNWDNATQVDPHLIVIPPGGEPYARPSGPQKNPCPSPGPGSHGQNPNSKD